ncbi:Hypothetical protein SMAX5B_008021 [Scophthalmus maximus]|uniref:Uncharacterized protein n=1 Tax=Scophthalmus maximus TaxID=52904 RepID=A0A2U9B3A3_SCOMX|nr:Hypothetical protein SMAX5B_008021 [Scophthalmus maximus]
MFRVDEEEACGVCAASLTRFCRFILRVCDDFAPHRGFGFFQPQTESEFFTFDSRTYFLFSVRELASYQDEVKCQDGGSASEGPAPGCQIIH